MTIGDVLRHMINHMRFYQHVTSGFSCIVTVWCRQAMSHTKLDGPIWASEPKADNCLWRCVTGLNDAFSLPALLVHVPHHVIAACRCWLHMLSLQSRITQADRDKFKWSSAGNTKITRKDGKITNVSCGLIIMIPGMYNHFAVMLIMSFVFFAVLIPFVFLHT